MPSRVRSLLKTFCACALVVLLAACARERPPTGTVRVETGDAVVNVAILTHGYSWGGVANDPVAPSDLADDDVPDLDVARTLEARASFSQPAIEVEVTRCAEDGSLEDVACALEEGTATFDVEPGWRYCVGAWFEDGDASYLFDAKSDQGEEATMGEFTSTALVVAARDGQVLLVDQETETPYYPTLPEGAPELAVGNVVRVRGNGIMLESYPAQYPGITSIELSSEGTPADAEKYAGLVAEVWPEKDPAEPPYASLEYATELAVVTIAPATCGYTWSFEEGGETQAVVADAPAPTSLGASELPDARVEGPTNATLSFDVPATSVFVLRWSESAEGLLAEGEVVDVADGSFAIEPGFRYAVRASFANGQATFVFTVR